jgi:hypothetical protein
MVARKITKARFANNTPKILDGCFMFNFRKKDNDAILYNEFVAQAIEGEDVKGKEMTTQNTTPFRRMMLKKEKNEIIYLC